jgi:hypothetical protein
LVYGIMYHIRNQPPNKLQPMKTIVILISTLTTLALAMLPAKAQVTYPGSGVADGTTADGNAFNSVVINNDATTISFTLNTTANMASYIFYGIEFQIVGQAGSGYTGFANPFGPAVGISSGQNAVIDTYGSGATPYTYSGGWMAGSSVGYAAGGTGSPSATITVPLGSLGLSAGSQFYFDVVSTYTSLQNGGPQAAYGALDNTGYLPESDGLYQPYNGVSHYDSATSSGTTFGTSATLYTVVPAPEPTTCTLMGLGALVMIRRMVRRNF